MEAHARNRRLELAPSLTERQFMTGVVREAIACGWLVFHDQDSRGSTPGYPDLTLVHEERGIIFAELKTEVGRPTEAQVRWLSQLRAASRGMDKVQVFLWRPRDWAEIMTALHGEEVPE